MNSKDKGNIGEATVLAEAVKRGYVVSQPFGDNAKYDLILDNGELLRVQVKAVSHDEDTIKVPCYSTGYLKETGTRGVKSHRYCSDDTDAN